LGSIWEALPKRKGGQYLTIAVIRRETNGWFWPGFTLAYLFSLAWIAAGITFWTATALGL